MDIKKEDYWKKYTDFDKEKIDQIEKIINSSNDYKPMYHIFPPNGLLNDPNGLIYYKGWYYIHYQWSPYYPIHGLKHWRLVKTRNFVTYYDCGVSNEPTLNEEKDGCFSGSSFIDKKQIKVIYTGNINDEYGNVFEENQIIGTLINNKILNKNVIIESEKTIFSAHQRDPKIFKYKKSEFIIFGSQLKNKKEGCLAFYKKNHEKYEYYNYVTSTFLNYSGYMWECPNINKIKNKYLFIYSPEGLKIENNKYNFQNYRNVAYSFFQKIDFKNKKLNELKPFASLDYGHDFYAPQTFCKNKKVLMLAWFGQVEVEYPNDTNYWSSMLTIPRELSFKNSILIQKPYKFFKENIFKNKKKITKKEFNISKAFNIVCSFKDEMNIKIKNDKNNFIEILFTKKEIILNRNNQTEKIVWSHEGERYATRLYKKQKIELYIDNSSLELFCNNYQTTFTSRFFIKDFNVICFSKIVKGHISNIEKCSWLKGEK